MIKIKNEKELNYYIEKYKLNNIFEKDIKKYMELHFFKKGEHIYRCDENINYFYFLVKGRAKVYTISKNGKALLLRFYKPCEIIGDIEIIQEIEKERNKFYSCNVESLDNTIWIGISFDNMKKHVKDDIKFLKYISKSLAYKLCQLGNSSVLNLLYPLENRLASYILALTYDTNSNKDIIEIEMCKLKDIAELLGSSYRHLLRTINALSDKKIIERKRNYIKILDGKKLEDLAGDIYK
ncbi:Crp/Fnr family transcriptional regulator [Tepidibacter formicigenes]|jgi:CRP-like cAMP-binding protein|uniref:cAMP-binding domain of CRP or a regulatory subunit of cAMP-dependent protein kinases n=1 Tax=Tepidibacter formicigenes DSM 15518 TaxID=1123349 RepID=A0A1M6NW35_9FIRM|nr:cyclic nucleotide-binding domain-containing protein [Tepidibacter formicigenes]SHJ99916.1 cAMP-binding domain of CRP or a regulatory subunit of cAMP-dependent protein kinases [Tepidibacter formicigenes DSM 15518]